MANPNVNRINTIIAAGDLTIIDNTFSTLGATINPYTQALTDDERTKLFSVVEENESFADDALQQAQTLIAQFPPALQNVVSNLQNDTTLGDQFEKIMKTQVLPLWQRIMDSQRLTAHERYSQALAIYKYIETGAGLGMPGFQAAYDVLRVRFAKQRGGRPKDE
jgi:hypothetical protein